MGFLRRSRPEAGSPLASTGHDGDDQLLRLMAAHTDLRTPRHWVHYLYFGEETHARGAAEVIGAAGWNVTNVDTAADGGPDWVVMVERHDAVLSPDAVRDARIFFEAVAATHGSGDYDGWEASA